MSLGHDLAIAFIRSVIFLLCRVDDAQLERIPTKGPLILVVNHVNFLDVPVLLSHLPPRSVSALVKADNWDHFFARKFFEFANSIPIRRGAIDMEAFRLAKTALKEERIVAIAPEGTRSNNGRLQKGRTGLVLLALRSGAPLQPMVYYGGENFRKNIKRLRRTDFKIVTGSPFRLNPERAGLERSAREKITNEIMYQLAALLPPAYRGVYADLSQATEDYLLFDGQPSNLLRAGAQQDRH
jgi:1-acyl-sn-glycerol-3-phosphate acyltransferase